MRSDETYSEANTEPAERAPMSSHDTMVATGLFALTALVIAAIVVGVLTVSRDSSRPPEPLPTFLPSTTSPAPILTTEPSVTTSAPGYSTTDMSATSTDLSTTSSLPTTSDLPTTMETLTSSEETSTSTSSPMILPPPPDDPNHRPSRQYWQSP